MAVTAQALRDDNGLLIVIDSDGSVDAHRLIDPDHLASYEENPEGFVKQYVARYCAECAANVAKEPAKPLDVAVSAKDISDAAKEI